MRVTALTIVMSLCAATASAQVGYPPNRSPYKDRDYNREWTYFAGQFSAEPDPLGVAPTDGPMGGVRWQMHLTGPIYFGVRLAGASVDRTILDPSKRVAERLVGTEKVPMAFADLQLEMSLTGHKTWHGLAPFINGGFGVVADLRGDSDVGNYRFGVPLAITLGTGVSWTPARNWSVRLDWSHYIYRIGYPNRLLPEGHRGPGAVAGRRRPVDVAPQSRTADRRDALQAALMARRQCAPLG